RGGDLSDGQPGVVGCHDRPDPFLFCRSQSCGRQTEACLELLLVPDALMEWFTSLHGLENTRVSHIFPANWTRWRTLFLKRCRKANWPPNNSPDCVKIPVC